MVAIVEGEWSPLRPSRFTPDERVRGTHFQESGLAQEAVSTTWRSENTCPYRDSNSDRLSGRPARSQPLYRLSYAGSMAGNTQGGLRFGWRRQCLLSKRRRTCTELHGSIRQSEDSRHFWSHMLHYRFQNSPLQNIILNHLNATFFVKVYFNIILPRTRMPPKWSLSFKLSD
jgi:hypothetical protein